jgi:hypothetical protein
MKSVRALLFVCACLTGTHAHALERALTQDGSVTVEASGFYKPYASWLVLPPALVASARELDALFDETRALLPPEQQGALPNNLALPQHVGITTHTVRVQGRAILFDNVELEGAYQLAGIFSSASSFGAGSTQAGVLGTALVQPKRRLVDLDPFLVDEGSARVQHNLDRASVRVQTSDFSITVGRQALSWGTGRLWNPTDLLSPFAPSDVDREVRRGADAVRVSLPIGVLTQMDVLWLPQQTLVDQGFVARMRTNLLGTDVSWSAAKYVQDLVLGADFSGDVGELGVHGEAAWTLPLVGLVRTLSGKLESARPVYAKDPFVRAVAGVDWRPAEAWVLTAEYYFNGFGTDDNSELLAKLSDPRVIRGEVFGAGRHYAGLVAAYMADDLITLSGTAIVNILDPGALLIPALEYWFAQNMLLRAGAFVPLAQGVDTRVITRLEPNDVLTNSDKFQHATTTFGARSEYGLSPTGAFVQVGVYFD